MPYSLNSGRTEFKGGKNILASTHLQFKQVGATLDAKKFPVGHVDVGQAIARNLTTGKFEPYAESEEGTLEPGYDEFSILNVDFVNDGENDTIVGEVIVRGSVYDAKLIGVTDAFRAATPMIRYVKEI